MTRKHTKQQDPPYRIQIHGNELELSFLENSQKPCLGIMFTEGPIPCFIGAHEIEACYRAIKQLRTHMLQYLRKQEKIKDRSINIKPKYQRATLEQQANRELSPNVRNTYILRQGKRNIYIWKCRHCHNIYQATQWYWMKQHTWKHHLSEIQLSVKETET